MTGTLAHLRITDSSALNAYFSQEKYLAGNLQYIEGGTLMHYRSACQDVWQLSLASTHDMPVVTTKNVPGGRQDDLHREPLN